MALRLDGLNPLSYMGVTPYQPPNLVIYPRPPTPNDSQNFNLGTIWIDTGTNAPNPPDSSDIWFLVSLVGSVATWVNFIGGGSSAVSLTTVFTEDGSWTKDSRTKLVKVWGWNGGSGGGSGLVNTGLIGNGTNAFGGPCTGGFFFEAPTMFWPNSLTVTIGQGGLGAAPQTANNSVGINGNIGTLSYFGPYIHTLLDVGQTPWGGGNGAGNGNVAFGAPVVSCYGYGTETYTGILLGANTRGVNITGLKGGQNRGLQPDQPGYFLNGTLYTNSSYSVINSLMTGTQGGSGGILKTQSGSTASANGTVGGSFMDAITIDIAPTIIIAGGAAGVTTMPYDGGDGNDYLTNDSCGFMMGGTGGGGGCAQQNGATRPGNGGNGGFPGGSGGGGGASINGTPSGAGGNGANGQIIVLEIF